MRYSVRIICVLPNQFQSQEQAARAALAVICDREQWPYAIEADVMDPDKKSVASYMRAHRF